MSIIQNENTIGKAFYGNKPIYMFDNGEAKYNEGFEEGKNDVINGSQELTITKNGVYITDYVNVSTGGDGEQQITGIYPDGSLFYDYVKLKDTRVDTNIIPTFDSRLEFWFKYTGEPSGDAWYSIIGAGATDDNNVYELRIFSSSWYFHIGSSNKSVYGVTTNEWHHIIVSRTDGIIIDGVQKGTVGSVGSYTIQGPFIINGVGHSTQRRANGEFGMIKIDDTIIIPTADGFKNLNTGEILQTLTAGVYDYTHIVNEDIFEIGDLVKKITVDITTEDTNGSYEDGYNDGVAEQKTKLETITITENGTYTKEDGYNEVVVNVATGGGSGKINVKELGIKLGNSTFSEVPDYFDWTGIKDMSFMFANCDNLTTFSQIDTSEVTTMRSMFEGCDNLVSISQLYAGNVTDVNPPFGLFGISSLTDIGGFINLKASWSGTGSFKDLPNLNYQSCVNILNGLYDFTGNGETPTSTQGQLQVHQNFLDLVGLNTISELATAKGWIISA